MLVKGIWQNVGPLIIYFVIISDIDASFVSYFLSFFLHPFGYKQSHFVSSALIHSPLCLHHLASDPPSPPSADLMECLCRTISLCLLLFIRHSRMWAPLHTSRRFFPATRRVSLPAFTLFLSSGICVCIYSFFWRCALQQRGMTAFCKRPC